MHAAPLKEGLCQEQLAALVVRFFTRGFAPDGCGNDKGSLGVIDAITRYVVRVVRYNGVAI